MLLTTNNKVKTKNKAKLAILKELTHNSKDLYNKALYTIKQHFFSTKEYLPYPEVYRLLKSSEEYKKLPSNASQQTLKQIDNAFKSFFKLLKAKNQGQKIHIPRYLDKDGHYKVIYTKIHLKTMDNGYIRLALPKYIKEKYKVNYLYFKIPKHIVGKEIKEVHILPYKPYYKISFVYSEGDKNFKHYTTDDIMAIDFGIDNLATVVTRYDRPILLDGKSLKSKNRYFNKKISVLLSSITKGKNPKEWQKEDFKRLNVWYQRRDNYIKEKYKVNYLYFKIPKYIKNKEIKEVHILPYKPHYKISFVYSDGDKNFNHYITDDIMAIDFGIDNLATVVTRYDKPILLDGKSLKSKNRYFNKRISVLLSGITKGKNPKEWQKENFKRLNIWYQRRDNYIKDYLHKTATKIINIAIEKGIKTIVVGYNKLWKNKCNIGRKNNEKFLSIPHSKLLQYIKYKAVQHKIEVIETEESYTSKCDALALEPIQKHEKYLGKRVKRGLFQSSIEKLINADVNGALNILRKSVACDSLIKEIAGRGLVFQPVRAYIHPYKPFHKGSSLYNS